MKNTNSINPNISETIKKIKHATLFGNTHLALEYSKSRKITWRYLRKYIVF